MNRTPNEKRNLKAAVPVPAGADVQGVGRDGNRPKRAPDARLMQISRRFSTARSLTLLVLVLYTLTLLTVYRREVTYDNFLYAVKDIFTIGGNAQLADETTMHYNISDGASLSLFGNNLAVIDGGTLRVLDAGGRESLSATLSVEESPALYASEKQLLLCDIGGTSYSLYNRVSRIFTKHTDFPIRDAAVAEKDGMFAVVTASEEYRFVVHLFDKNGLPVAKYYKEDYVLQTLLRADGGEMTLLCADADNGTWVTKIYRYVPGESEGMEPIVLHGVYPLAAAYADDKLVLASDRALYFFDEKGAQTAEAVLPDTPLYFEVSGKRVFVVAPTDAIGGNGESAVQLFDTAGKLLYNETVNGTVSDIAVNGEAGWMILGNRVLAVRENGAVMLDEKVTENIESPRFLFPIRDKVLLCGSAHAKMLSLP